MKLGIVSSPLCSEYVHQNHETFSSKLFQCLKRCYEGGLHNIVSEVLQSNLEEFGDEYN